MIVVSLVVLIPLIARLHPVEESRLPRPVLVLPLVVARRQVYLAMEVVTLAFPTGVEAYLALLKALGSLCLEQLLVPRPVQVPAARARRSATRSTESLDECSANLPQYPVVLVGI